MEKTKSNVETGRIICEEMYNFTVLLMNAATVNLGSKAAIFTNSVFGGIALTKDLGVANKSSINEKIGTVTRDIIDFILLNKVTSWTGTSINKAIKYIIPIRCCI
jgi:hypothetical protein